MKKYSSSALFIFTIIIGISYEMLGYTGLNESILTLMGTIWNLLFAFTAGFYFMKSKFLSQFRHFSFKTLLWGLPLIIVVGIFFSSLYSHLFGSPTTNSIGESISLIMIFVQIPFMLMGEELLSTTFF